MGVCTRSSTNKFGDDILESKGSKKPIQTNIDSVIELDNNDEITGSTANIDDTY